LFESLSIDAPMTRFRALFSALASPETAILVSSCVNTFSAHAGAAASSRSDQSAAKGWKRPADHSANIVSIAKFSERSKKRLKVRHLQTRPNWNRQRLPTMPQQRREQAKEANQLNERREKDINKTNIGFAIDIQFASKQLIIGNPT
jgi:hypothetical protein